MGPNLTGAKEQVFMVLGSRAAKMGFVVLLFLENKKTLPSVDKSIHGRRRGNFYMSCVTFSPCTSLYASFQCLAHGKIPLFPTP